MSENERTQHLYKVTLTWHDKVEVLEGWGTDRQSAAADAMNSAGYGDGALGALKGWDAEQVKNSRAQKA
jgi:hypothetical protein